MKQTLLVSAFVTLSACAHLPWGGAPAASDRAEMWHEAHMALYASAYSRADSLFTQLAMEHPNTTEGREATFYIGTLHLDPRNPEFSLEQTEAALARYLAQDTVGARVYRRPEATTLLVLARELNRPEEERIAALRTRAPVVISGPPEQGAAPPQLRTVMEENERLRRQVQQQTEQIRQQQQELERIRRVLTPRTP